MTFQYFASRTIRLASVLAAMVLAAGGCSSDDVATSPDAQRLREPGRHAFHRHHPCRKRSSSRRAPTCSRSPAARASAAAGVLPCRGHGRQRAGRARRHRGLAAGLELERRRLLGTGSGGFGGAIVYGGLMSAIANGYAAANTDTGHLGGASGAIGQVLGWAVDPVQLRDWGRTSVHLMTSLGQGDRPRLLRAGRAARLFRRTVRPAATRRWPRPSSIPDDYDGIHAGSPGMGYSHLMESFLVGRGCCRARSPRPTLTPAAMALLSTMPCLNQCGGSQAAGDGLPRQSARLQL